jgi:hypothetical protein
MRMNAKSLIIACDGFRDSCHCLLEVLVTRIDVKPLLQYVVRRQLGELLEDRGLLCVFRADQRAMPFPSASLGWFDQDHHHAAKQIDGQPPNILLVKKLACSLKTSKVHSFSNVLFRDFHLEGVMTTARPGVD